MIEICVFAEGPTEQKFLNDLILPFLHERKISLKRTFNMHGLKKYSEVKARIENECTKNPGTYFTTMFDFFRLPKDFPGQNGVRPTDGSLQKAEYLEEEMNKDINFRNFFANIIVHEFEALLFSDPVQFKKCCRDSKVIQRLLEIREKFPSPEHVNGGAKTAPSKRILQIYPGYNKHASGSLIAQAIGLDKILENCPHFRKWIERLTKLDTFESTKNNVQLSEVIDHR